MSEEEVEAPVESAPAPSLGLGAGNPKAEKSQDFSFDSEDTYNKFRASLPEDLRERPLFKNTKNLHALANQALNSESALGKKRLEEPQGDWDDAKWDDFFSKIRPEDADKYVGEANHKIVLEEGADPIDFTIPEESIK